MKPVEQVTTYYFVDESGDSTFFDRRGNCIVGNEGCSKYLMLGFIKTSDPELLRRSLTELRNKLAADSYFSGIKRFKERTLSSFHAKDDAPEVRYEVFKTLQSLPLKAQFIFARKRESTFRNSFHGVESKFYDHLISHLFKNQLHLSSEINIYFAKRGSRDRQAPLQAAVDNARQRFLSQFAKTNETNVKIQCQSPIGEPCLQIVDYYLWAVQRLFTAREDRFYKVISHQIEFIWDLYGPGYPKNIFTTKNPLELEKVSPL